MLSGINSLLKMCRLKNSLLAAVTIIAGNFIASVDISFLHLLLDCASMMIAVGFANIHNDLLDIETDRINRPDRPLPSGAISLKKAKIACLVTAIAPVALGFALSITHGLFYLVLIAFLFAYNKILKRLPLVKNIMVAILCASPLLISVIDGHYWNPRLYPPAVFAFLLTLAREIFKDLEDVSGDMLGGIITFPVAAGTKKALHLAIFITVFTLLFLPLPVLTLTYPVSFLLFTGILVAPVLIFVIIRSQKHQFDKAQALLKVAMLTGIISIVASIVINL